MTSEYHHPGNETETAPSSLKRKQQIAMLAWGLGLPIGWLLGWAAGAGIAYKNYIPSESIPPDRIQAFIDSAIAAGGLKGGEYGALIGLATAYTITLIALQSVISEISHSSAD